MRVTQARRLVPGDLVRYGKHRMLYRVRTYPRLRTDGKLEVGALAEGYESRWRVFRTGFLTFVSRTDPDITGADLGPGRTTNGDR